MNPSKPIRAALAVAILAVATSAAAQVSADKSGKSTSGSTPAATPVTPGAPGMPLSGDDARYSRYWSAIDANNDGKVTREEYNAYHSSRWDQYDASKRGYYDKQTMRELYLDREMSKTDGHPKGTPLNPTTKK